MKITKIFFSGESTYGVDRVCGKMREKGYKASYGKVKRILDKNNLHSIHKKKRSRSLTDSRKSRGDKYNNIVKDLKITEPFQVITSDISYIRTGEGFDYICKIKDVKSGIVLSYAMANRMKADLVVEAIKKAVSKWGIANGVIFHSDRGAQFTSNSVKELLRSNGIIQSFSRVGRPGDNAWSESFFANMKKEIIHWKSYGTRRELRLEMFKYIEGFYNTRRIQKRLGYISPVEWLKKWQISKELLVA